MDTEILIIAVVFGFLGSIIGITIGAIIVKRRY